MICHTKKINFKQETLQELLKALFFSVVICFKLFSQPVNHIIHLDLYNNLKTAVVVVVKSTLKKIKKENTRQHSEQSIHNTQSVPLQCHPQHSSS